MRTRAAWAVVASLVGAPALAHAQTIDGTAEWALASNGTRSNNQTNGNRSFLQNYTIGLGSSLFDPRLAKINSEVTLRTNSLRASGSSQPDQEGNQHDLGYRLGASLLQASAFPFFIQASRLNTNTSGDLAPSNPIRSAAGIQVSDLTSDFDTRTDQLSMGGQFNAGRLPHVEVNYRKGGSVVTGGPFRSEQKNADLSAAVTKDTQRIRQSLRYQRSAFDNFFPQTFTQRLNNLDYDFAANVSTSVRLTLHGGGRNSYSQLALPPLPVDPAAAPYTPPSADGRTDARYVSAGISYEPTVRLALRVVGAVDRQTAADASTNARLATVSAHYEVVRGLSLNGSGTSGNRGEVLGGVPITVVTRSGVAGVTYRTGVRWLEGSVGATRGLGTNTSPDGRVGRSQSWSTEASLSSTIRRVSLGSGYERANSRDQILLFGNYDSERYRLSAQAASGAALLSLSADQLRIQRGTPVGPVSNLQRTFSGTVSWRLKGDNLAAASAGGFSNDYSGAIGNGRDQTLFWTIGGQFAPRAALRVTTWVRSEFADATSTRFSQQGLSAFGRVEYRLRTLNAAVEYRHNTSRVRYATMADPDRFRGHQVRFSVSRRFAFIL